MKKTVSAILMTIMLLVFCGMNLKAQEQPAPKKDTVNMDTHAKPEFYYNVEDGESMKTEKKSNTTTIIIVIGAVVVVGGAAFFLLKKKK